MQEFGGKVAVVTGAASGIGRALSQRLADEGMKIALADIEVDALEAARKELSAAGNEVIAVRTDVSQADSVQQLAEATLEAFGKVHVVCNNAGVLAGGKSWQCPLSDYEWVFGVNQWGVVHGIRTFIPIMIEQGEPGHIVNTASMAGMTNSPLAAAYYMSKHAVVALSETLYLELEAEEAPIGVTVLCPELVNTGIGRSERNRPLHLKRGELDADPGRDLIESAIRELLPTGLQPRVMAERVVQAIRDDRFYILSEEGGSWRRACETRLDDIRLGRNPTMQIPAGN